MGITTVFSSKNGSWWYITCLIILELLPNYIITITVEFGLKNSAENIGTHLYLDNLPTSGNHTFHKRKCKAVKMCLDTSGHVLTQLDLTDVIRLVGFQNGHHHCVLLQKGPWWYITYLIVLELLSDYILTITFEFELKNCAQNIWTHLYFLVGK